MIISFGKKRKTIENNDIIKKTIATIFCIDRNIKTDELLNRLNH